MLTIGTPELKNEWLNTMILSKALGGYSDCNGPITINWRFEYGFVFALIQEYTGKWWYRLFQVKDTKFEYSFLKILNPSHRSNSLFFVYEFFCDNNTYEREIRYFAKGDWYFTIRRYASEYLSISQDHWIEDDISQNVIGMKPYWLSKWEKWKNGTLLLDIPPDDCCTDIDLLSSLDISFKNKADTKVFLTIVREELEVRIGIEISNNLSALQLIELDDCIKKQNGEGAMWLNKNFPEYISIVSNKKRELAVEINAYRSLL